MTFRLTVEIIDGTNEAAPLCVEVASIERKETSPDNLGLHLNESKSLLKKLQNIMVHQQIEVYLQGNRNCPDCGKHRRLKDNTEAIFHTVFGKVTVANPRLHHCTCQPHETKTFRPLTRLLPERSTPELLYIQTKWASLASYGITVKLLKDVLPIDDKISDVTVRNHLHQVATKMDEQLAEEQHSYIDGCPREWAALAVPDGPMTVGLDGGYVRSTEKGKFFEVIAGKSLVSFRREVGEILADTLPSSEESGVLAVEQPPRPTTDGHEVKCFGFVHTFDDKAKRRVFETLKAQGLQHNQQITFLSDGGESLRGLQDFLSPQADYVLDWFHITMRLTVLKQTAKGLPEFDKNVVLVGEDKASIQETIKSIKHYLWHGNSYRALQKLSSLEDCLYVLAEDLPNKAIKNLYKYLSEMHTYIKNNQHYIPNYGERYRTGERISTGFVESTINQVVSKRLCKKQQMRWTKQGAHQLLQTRTKVLNQDLVHTFREWYPGFQILDAELQIAA